MPCYQPSSFPPGFSTTGRPSYATEAECNQACKEGACCEGTTCTVKPQCQCQGTGKVFKGVGTTCTPNPCLCCNSNGSIKSGTDCQWCWCFCGEGAATYPRFINVTVSGQYAMYQPIFFGQSHFGTFNKKIKTFSATLTLSVISTPSKTNCPLWRYGVPDGNTTPIGGGGMTGEISVSAYEKSLTEGYITFDMLTRDVSESSGFNAQSWAPGWSIGVPLGLDFQAYEPKAFSGRYLSGTCMTDMVGKQVSTVGFVGDNQATVTVNGVQA